MVPGSFAQFCIDQIFPERCIICGTVISGAGAAPSATSRAARAVILTRAAPVCPACSAPPPLLRLPPSWPEAAIEFFGIDFSVRLFPGIRVSAQVLCTPCWLMLEPVPSPPSHEKAVDAAARGLCVISPFYSNNPLLAVVKYLKFSSGRRAVPPLSWWMAHAVRRCAGVRTRAPNDPVITAVPLHPARRRRRGYNQAALLAAGVAGILDLPFTEALLMRTRNTRAQSKLPAEKRSENVRGAFAARNGGLIEGRRIILVDDLVTTGETVRACIRALREANPLSVIVLAAGRARNLLSGDNRRSE